MRRIGEPWRDHDKDENEHPHLSCKDVVRVKEHGPGMAHRVVEKEELEREREAEPYQAHHDRLPRRFELPLQAEGPYVYAEEEDAGRGRELVRGEISQAVLIDEVSDRAVQDRDEDQGDP